LRSNSKQGPKQTGRSPAKVDDDEVDGDFDDLVVNKTNSFVGRRDSDQRMKMSELKPVEK